MKKHKKMIISIVSSILIVLVGVLVFNKYFYDANKLNLIEKEWLNNHKTSVISINVPNELNIFSKAGKGVFYDFLSGIEKEHEIVLNKNVINIGAENGLGFVVKKDIDKDDLLIHIDHYVVVAKEYETVNSLSDLSGKTIGMLSEETARVTTNYKTSLKYSTYDNKNNLLTALKDEKISYIIVPLNEYLDEILSNNYKIIYHLDDIVNYYYLNLGEDKTLNSIITKYYNRWIKNNFEESFSTNTYNLFIDKLNITQIDIDNMTNKTYTYGFTNSIPFQTLSSSKYGGKIISYIEDFSKFSKVDFTYTKFKNNNELVKAFEKNKVDLLFDNTSYNIKGTTINSNINNRFVIISPLKDYFKASNINDITNKTIYALKDSKLATELKANTKLNIELVNNEKDLIKATNKNRIVALSKEAYNYLANEKIHNYQISFEGLLNNYNFKYRNNNDTLSKLFENYINYLSDYQVSNNGYLSYRAAESNGNLISMVAKYILLVISVIVVIIAVIIASRKHVKLNTKRIKKEEKLKYVDMLTSLKNRNYLNERIDIWNQNTIYPQGIIVIDLNNIKYINDTFGAKEGDKQIMAAANILHQTQLDNTEIMRTDGNEFMIYLVGYNEKQVVNYLKKLVKEFNELPYEYGAAFGFSMIVDDLKLIDDAINEATIQMRGNKEIDNEKSENEN